MKGLRPVKTILTKLLVMRVVHILPESPNLAEVIIGRLAFPFVNLFHAKAVKMRKSVEVNIADAHLNNHAVKITIPKEDPDQIINLVEDQSAEKEVTT